MLRTPVILACDVHKSFGAGQRRQPVLCGINLEVTGGETLYLVGPSGSGKTTLLSILGCILTADEGQVQVFGQEVTRMSAQRLLALRRRRIGFIFQTFNLFPTLSVCDNVCLALAMQGVPRRAATQRAVELLHQVGLGQRLWLKPPQLSTGECQRVAVARALAADPEIVLADEPTAALDAVNGQAVMHLLHRLVCDRGATLVVVTHDERIFPLANRVLRLANGRLIHERTVAACELDESRTPSPSSAGESVNERRGGYAQNSS
jgi:putative ABC transport system ATP-binding protein